MATLGAAYASGYRVPTPPILQHFSHALWCSIGVAGLGELEDIIDAEFTASQDEHILAHAGHPNDWWNDLPQTPTELAEAGYNISTVLGGLMTINNVVKSAVHPPSASGAPQIEDAFNIPRNIYPWQKSDSASGPSAPQASTARPLDPAHKSILLSHLEKVIKSIDSTFVFSQAALARAIEASEQSQERSTCLQKLLELYEKDELHLSNFEESKGTFRTPAVGTEHSDASDNTDGSTPSSESSSNPTAVQTRLSRKAVNTFQISSSYSSSYNAAISPPDNRHLDCPNGVFYPPSPTVTDSDPRVSPATTEITTSSSDTEDESSTRSEDSNPDEPFDVSDSEDDTNGSEWEQPIDSDDEKSK
ncbi:hypothetical protein CPB83DRAFT_890697 [Crepidotus variabilis]|uniref:Uncharacterized protein n=1 Tax=Crepidotus variabilis TaxID=179855 RepID=A0A9P6EP31_9AGAR|nr:hypothetical protein CPB83DRAFT_890697 [Crepidotus variabilis]